MGTVKCTHNGKKMVRTTYLGKKEEGGKIASVTKWCGECGEWLSHSDRPEAYMTGTHFSYQGVSE